MSYNVGLQEAGEAFSKLAICRLLALNATAIGASAQVFASPEMSETGEQFAVFLATLIQRDRRASTGSKPTFASSFRTLKRWLRNVKI